MPKDDKTEKPTAKRKAEAKRKGQVAKSPDVSGWIGVLVGSYLVPAALRSGTARIGGLFQRVGDGIANPSPHAALALLGSGLGDVLALVLPIAIPMAIVGVVTTLAQTRGNVSVQRAKPKWEHLNPMKGIKRLFSAQQLWQLAKQVLKLVVLLVVAVPLVMGIVHTLAGARPAAMAPIVSYDAGRILVLVREVALGGVVIAIGDFAYNRHHLNKGLKMTKQEVKDENRQSQGDPKIKGEIRKKQMIFSRMRMMAAIAGADFVVTNPTHFAVALRYDPRLGPAPRVVAKGTGPLALRIRQEAVSHGVPVVEDPPVARALYAVCDLDAAIPPELYLAVARLLAFVMALPETVRRAGISHHRPHSAMVA